MIENVTEITPEFQRLSFTYSKLLRKGHVEVVNRPGRQSIPAGSRISTNAGPNVHRRRIVCEITDSCTRAVRHRCDVTALVRIAGWVRDRSITCAVGIKINVPSTLNGHVFRRLRSVRSDPAPVADQILHRPTGGAAEPCWFIIPTERQPVTAIQGRSSLVSAQVLEVLF